MRAVLDPNVIISGLLAPGGAPANILRSWLEGRFELIASDQLLAELKRATQYPKLAERIPSEDVDELIALIRRTAQMTTDPADPPVTRSRDPHDDYIIALAAETRSAIVSGDRDLLTLSDALPVYSPVAFLALIDEAR